MYIYYKVAQAAAAKAAVDKIFAQIRQQCGIIPALLQRADDPTTWMEVYEGIADLAGFTAALEAAEAASGIQGCLVTGAKRIRERFVPLPGNQ